MSDPGFWCFVLWLEVLVLALTVGLLELGRFA